MKNSIKISIGTKFIALILVTLSTAVIFTVSNALNLFKKDNLNNIYVSSDLLTSAKAEEVGTWLNSLLQKGGAIGRVMLAHHEEILKNFENDSDILSVSFYHEGHSIAPSGVPTPSKSLSWINTPLLKTTGIGLSDLKLLEDQTTTTLNRALHGVVSAKAEMSGNDRPLLALFVPFIQSKPGSFSTVLELLVVQQKLFDSFANTGAYTLSLVDSDGGILANSDLNMVREHANLSVLPTFMRMRESTLDREFHEYSQNGVSYLGAFAKVSLAGWGVISQVDKSKAFEAGQTLIRRSVLISVLVLSISFILAYVFAQTLILPIRTLSRAAESFAHGNFGVRVKVGTRDEMATLAEGFNSMTSEIEKKILNLSKINDSSKVISSTLEVQKLMEFSLQTLIDLLQAKHAAVWLVELGTKNRRTIKIASGIQWSSQELDPDIMDTLLNQQSKQAQIMDKGKLLSVPICQKSKIMGYVTLKDRKDRKGFTSEDVSIAETLVTSIGITFENIDLLKRTADKVRMEKELETAKLVQDTMFPASEVRLPHFEIQSFYTPASECGGDWWGLFPLSNERVLLAIGDATGHGVPAALVTATAKAAFTVIHQLARELPKLLISPSVIMSLLNKTVYESTRGSILMTFFVAVVDGRTGKMEFASASHEPIYRYKMPNASGPTKGTKDNIEVLLAEPGPRLGMEADARYQSSKHQLNSNDLLLLYTDGLTEGLNLAQEEYGNGKLLRSIAKHAHKSTRKVRDGVLGDFEEFIEKEPLHDDVTLVVCRFS